MSRPEAAFMWPSAAAWVSGLRLALFGHRPLAEHMRAGLRRVTRRAYPRWGMLVSPEGIEPSIYRLRERLATFAAIRGVLFPLISPRPPVPLQLLRNPSHFAGLAPL